MGSGPSRDGVLVLDWKTFQGVRTSSLLVLGMLLRRRALTGTVLLLVFLCLCYLSRNRSKSQSGSQGPSAERLLETRRLISALDYAHEDAQVSHSFLKEMFGSVGKLIQSGSSSVNR